MELGGLYLLKWCRAIRLSGCITSKKADKLSRVDMFRLVASVSIECARMGIVVIGGIGIGWNEGLGTLYSLGRMGGS